MKLSILCIVMVWLMVWLVGCNYGDETLKVVHPETISLIENPESREAKEIFGNYKSKGWFFVPQVISRPHEDRAWLALRVYSYGSRLDYKIKHADIRFSGKSIAGIPYSSSEEPSWHPAVNGWSYQVSRVESYSYSGLMNSGIDSAEVDFEVAADVNGERVVQRESFKLKAMKVRRSGW